MEKLNADTTIRFKRKVTVCINHFDEVTRENVKEENFTFYKGDTLIGTFSEDRGFSVDFDYRDVPLIIFDLDKYNFDVIKE